MSFDRAEKLDPELPESQSLSSRAMSFDALDVDLPEKLEASQSLSSRAMSFDNQSSNKKKMNSWSQSLSSRAMSFDEFVKTKHGFVKWSQSLSSRAMSFDLVMSITHVGEPVSIPFEQGDVFRRSYSYYHQRTRYSLNPFRAGRCLSTKSCCFN